MSTLDDAPDHVLHKLAAMTDFDGENETARVKTRTPTPATSVDEEGPIVVVHGHAVAVRHEVVRVLERATGVRSSCSIEQAHSGRTLLESRGRAHRAGRREASDVDGLVHIQIDASGAWKQVLARELAAAAIDIDYARIP